MLCRAVTLYQRAIFLYILKAKCWTSKLAIIHVWWVVSVNLCLLYYLLSTLDCVLLVYLSIDSAEICQHCVGYYLDVLYTEPPSFPKSFWCLNQTILVAWTKQRSNWGIHSKKGVWGGSSMMVTSSIGGSEDLKLNHKSFFIFLFSLFSCLQQQKNVADGGYTQIYI